MMFGHNDDNQQTTQADVTAEPTATAVTADDSASAVDEPTDSTPQTSTAASADDFLPAPSEPTDTTSSPAAPVAAGADDLLALKQQALQHLSPLVGHLDQTPEEKFRTTMMMIQASDDQSLLRTAYEAAEAITDEKTKAQALLDVVNEINYFTQHPTA